MLLTFDFLGVVLQIWETVKRQLQTEFADIVSSDAANIFSEPKSGHISLDYTCLKWMQLERKVFYFTNQRYSFLCTVLLYADYLFVSGIDLVSAVQKKRNPGSSLLVL